MARGELLFIGIATSGTVHVERLRIGLSDEITGTVNRVQHEILAEPSLEKSK